MASLPCRQKVLRLITRSPRVRIIAEYLIKYPDSLDSLHTLSEELAMHPSSLSRFFSGTAEVSLREFRRAIRIEIAAWILLNEECSVRNLSKMVGYTNVSSFVRSFRVLKGCPPKEYRERAFSEEAL
jgi:AraC-like DNA-binding protein